MRLRFQRRQQEARKFSLINAGRLLQQRTRQSKSRLSVMMENNCQKEKVLTQDLEKVSDPLSTEQRHLIMSGMQAVEA